MPDLPHLSGAEIIKVFKKLGFSVVRQKGSHVVLRKGNVGCVVPMHKEVALGTLKNALKQSGIQPQQFIDTYQDR